MEEYEEADRSNLNNKALMSAGTSGKMMMMNHQRRWDTLLSTTVAAAAASSISEEIREEEKKNMRLVCPNCWKDFKSPKALAGHMRIHAPLQPRPPTAPPPLYNKLLKKHHQPPMKMKMKMMMKMKMKMKMMDPNYTTTLNNNNNNKKEDDISTDDNLTCSICSKSFPSKKSLFGHMRCHPDRPRRGLHPPHHHPLVVPTTSSPHYYNCYVASSSDGDDDPKLNHHHDHDDYSPSPTRSRDLTEYVPSSWSITDRRGRSSSLRKEITPAPPPPTSSIYDDDHHKLQGDFLAFHGRIQKLQDTTTINYCKSSSSTAAAAELIDFNYPINPTTDYGSNNNHKSEAVSRSSALGETFGAGGASSIIHSLKFSAITNNTDGVNGYNKGEGKAAFVIVSTKRGGRENFPEDHWDDDESDGRNVLGTININDSNNGGKMVMPMKNKKMRKKVKLMADLELEEEGGGGGTKTKKRSYKCDICNKGFPSHQALGGHRSSHNKFKVSIIDTSTASTARAAAVVVKNKADQLQQQVEEETLLVNVNDVVQRECKICKKSFPTGQALGGHKRCHWTPPQPLMITSSSACSSSNSQIITGGRRLLNFDLNEMPPADTNELDA